MSLQSSPSPPSGPLPGAQGGAATSSRSDPTWRGVRDTATSTLGRVLIAALGLKLVVGVLGSAVPGWLRVLDVGGSIVLVVALGYLLVRILVLLQRRLLWRVRRRLVLSYVLIGFVPIVLIVSFFLLAGVLMLGTESSSRVQLSFEDVVDDAAGLAATTAVDLRGLADPAPDAVSAVLERRIRGIEERYPSASIVVVPRAEGAPSRVTAGPWRHTAEPPAFPAWLAQESRGIVMTGNSGRRDVVARAAEVIDVGGGAVAVVADLPLGDDVVARMQAFTRITLIDAGATSAVAGAVAGDAVLAAEDERASFGPGGQPAAAVLGFRWVSDFDLLEWSTGEQGRGTVNFRFYPSAFYDQVIRGSFASIFWIVLLAIGVMFLTIEAVALVMGFALGKSITGAVHELFTGTERVRRGDFSHRIQVETQDQFGELAGSFNAMTESIADLLEQAKEKRRLKEELRIARDIQMSLLPSGPITFPGLAMTAMCRPASEVGGDYYDFMPLGEHRLGVLVADVSGKGTSAAFYMAELKGLILSLSQIYQSPKRLLLEVNRILSANLLDNRTFITMLYAVLDLEARTMTYVRAGHTPLIYVPADGHAPGRSQVLMPDGLVVGLHLEGIEEKFAELLEEQTLPIDEGDLFAFFTDGITEAMNEESDLFGEERLSRLLEEHAHLPSDELREQILGDVEAFVGGADQHDDMTIVLLRIDELPPRGVDA
ncbi:MAG TPA: HAMP domain-containing protein [Acidobacteria bacterium]|nr:HAMP domain-containing protein [Acidobacteriota bacterium]